MTDIFISHSRADHDKIAKLAGALEAESYSVWWDKRIQSGAEFSKDIEAELAAAKVVIVCWSKHANDSRWVKDEANAGAEAGKLMTVSLDGETPPMGFRQFHCADLSKWHRKPKDAAFADFADAVKTRLRGIALQAPRPSKNLWPQKSLKSISLVALTVVVIAASVYLLTKIDSNAPPDGLADSRESAGTGQPVQTVAAAPEKSIAVLPFADISAAHDQAYFADGVAEEILNALAKIEGLKVTGRTSSFSFKNKNEDLRAVGASLGVANILEGSVRTHDNQVRISAQLIRAADGFQLWSDTYDGELVDIFDLQERIARAIVSELKIRIGGDPKPVLVAGSTKDVEAYRLYLEGRAHLFQRVGDNLPSAINLFERAVARDSEFARAFASLAAAYVILDAYVPGVDPAEAEAKARSYAERAIALDPSFAEPYAVLGHANVLRRRFVEAREQFDRALALGPNNSTARLWSGIALFDTGSLNEAGATFDRVIALDPAWSLAFAWRSFVASCQGDRALAEKMAYRALALGHPGGNRALAELAADRGDGETAVKRYVASYDGRGLVSQTFDREQITALARGAFLGPQYRVRALKIIDGELAQRRSSLDRLIPATLLHLGEYERAFDVYSNAGPGSDDVLVYLYLWRQSAKAVRRHPKFHEFASKTGLLDYWKRYGWPDLCRPLRGREPDAFECD